VFVDDGSTDLSLIILKEFSARNSWKNIKILKSQHLWLTRARKLWYEAIDDWYILILDADQKLRHNYIELLKETAVSNNAKFLTWKRVPYINWFSSKVLKPIYELFYAWRLANDNTITRIEWWNMMISKKDCEKIWWLKSGVLEDTELSERARNHGYTLYTNPKAEILHKYDAKLWDILLREFRYWYRIRDQKILTLTNFIKFWTVAIITFPVYYIVFFLSLIKVNKKIDSHILSAPIYIYLMFLSWSLGLIKQKVKLK
jgi:GT2 family glycosyltransferase